MWNNFERTAPKTRQKTIGVSLNFLISFFHFSIFCSIKLYFQQNFANGLTQHETWAERSIGCRCEVNKVQAELPKNMKG